MRPRANCLLVPATPAIAESVRPHALSPEGSGLITRLVQRGRSRNRLWHKGEQSGNTQRVKSIQIDCDGDAVVLRVDQRGGAACHTGKRSCFFRKLEEGQWVDEGVQVFDPKEVYGS